jgi:hypothetical protein
MDMLDFETEFFCWDLPARKDVIIFFKHLISMESLLTAIKGVLVILADDGVLNDEVLGVFSSVL